MISVSSTKGLSNAAERKLKKGLEEGTLFGKIFLNLGLGEVQLRLRRSDCADDSNLQSERMSTPPGPELKFFMAKTELVMEVGQA